MQKTCRFCKFWKESSPLGQCRAKAPRLFVVFGDATRHYKRTPEEIAQFTLFPVTSENDAACGTFIKQ